MLQSIEKNSLEVSEIMNPFSGSFLSNLNSRKSEEKSISEKEELINVSTENQFQKSPVPQKTISDSSKPEESIIHNKQNFLFRICSKWSVLVLTSFPYTYDVNGNWVGRVTKLHLPRIPRRGLRFFSFRAHARVA